MRRATVVAVLLALLASGCGERPEPVGRNVSPYPVTVAGAGGSPAVVTRSPKRIVALARGPADLVVALGAGPRLVGAPAGVSVDGAAPRRVVGAGGRIDVGEVVQLDPDLIVATPESNQLDVSVASRETGAAVYVEPNSSFEDVQRAAVELGLLVGRPVEARRIAASLRLQAERVQAQVEARPPVRVFVDTGFLITVPARSLVGDLVERAGGVSVAGESPRAEPFRPCEVVRLRPQVVLRIYEPGERRTVALARFRRCRGAGGGTRLRLVDVPASLVARPGPQVARGLAAIARALHPDAFR